MKDKLDPLEKSEHSAGICKLDTDMYSLPRQSERNNVPTPSI